VETTGAGTTSAADASAQLYARHGRMVFGLCGALLRDPTEAEDAAQQVFLSAHRSLLNGAEPREPAAWLATIARNECWARIRSRMREPLAMDAADAVGGVDPVYEAIRRADLAALWRAIRALPRQQRDALLLREFGGLRYDELAAALAVTEPAVESLLFRARARLRLQLQPIRVAVVPVARWLVGGGAPALATKAVAVGLVTGTAVLAPEVVERHHAPPPAPVQRAAVVHQAPKQPSAPPEALQAVRLPPAAPVARRVTTQRRREVRHERGNRGEGGSDNARTVTAAAPPTTTAEHSGGGQEGPGGGETATVPTTTTEEAAVLATTTSGDGGADGHGGSSGPDGGSDGSDGSDGPG
jgi:RNA polymerase sigma factor (sigma-70 family)